MNYTIRQTNEVIEAPRVQTDRVVGRLRFVVGFVVVGRVASVSATVLCEGSTQFLDDACAQPRWFNDAGVGAEGVDPLNERGSDVGTKSEAQATGAQLRDALRGVYLPVLNENCGGLIEVDNDANGMRDRAKTEVALVQVFEVELGRKRKRSGLVEFCIAKLVQCEGQKCLTSRSTMRDRVCVSWIGRPRSHMRCGNHGSNDNNSVPVHHKAVRMQYDWLL